MGLSIFQQIKDIDQALFYQINEKLHSNYFLQHITSSTVGGEGLNSPVTAARPC